MKVGDLVELSSRGKNLKYCKEFIGKVGLISSKDRTDWDTAEVNKEWLYVDWCGGKKNSPHLRSDLKYAKSKK